MFSNPSTLLGMGKAAAVSTFGNETQRIVAKSLYDDNVQVLNTFDMNRLASLTYDCGGDGVSTVESGSGSMSKYRKEDKKASEEMFDLFEKTLNSPEEYSVLTLQKTLALTKHVMIHGSDGCIQLCWKMGRAIEQLQHYNTAIQNQKSNFLAQLKGGEVDKAFVIRQLATDLYSLMQNVEQIQLLRMQAASSLSLVPLGSTEQLGFAPSVTTAAEWTTHQQRTKANTIKSNVVKGRSESSGFGGGFHNAAKGGGKVVSAAHGLEEMMERARLAEEKEQSRYFDNATEEHKWRQKCSSRRVDPTAFGMPAHASAGDLLDAGGYSAPSLDANGTSSKPPAPPAPDLLDFSTGLDTAAATGGTTDLLGGGTTNNNTNDDLLGLGGAGGGTATATPTPDLLAGGSDLLAVTTNTNTNTTTNTNTNTTADPSANSSLNGFNDVLQLQMPSNSTKPATTAPPSTLLNNPNNNNNNTNPTATISVMNTPGKTNGASLSAMDALSGMGLMGGTTSTGQGVMRPPASSHAAFSALDELNAVSPPSMPPPPPPPGDAPPPPPPEEEEEEEGKAGMPSPPPVAAPPPLPPEEQHQHVGTEEEANDISTSTKPPHAGATPETNMMLMQQQQQQQQQQAFMMQMMEMQKQQQAAMMAAAAASSGGSSNNHLMMEQQQKMWMEMQRQQQEMMQKMMAMSMGSNGNMSMGMGMGSGSGHGEAVAPATSSMTAQPSEQDPPQQQHLQSSMNAMMGMMGGTGGEGDGIHGSGGGGGGGAGGLRNSVPKQW